MVVLGEGLGLVPVFGQGGVSGWDLRVVVPGVGDFTSMRRRGGCF